MTATAHAHEKGGGELERRLLPVYLAFLILAPFGVALLFLNRDTAYLRITLLLIGGNLYPVYMMIQSMLPVKK